jgi:hydrogenase assembly chaperone HypC/HupF
MCIAVPGKVQQIENGVAIVTYPGIASQKALVANMPVAIGDSVMVQMGIIVKILSKDEADSVHQAWSQVTTKLSDSCQKA